jgi:hypothetical protein
MNTSRFTRVIILFAGVCGLVIPFMASSATPAMGVSSSGVQSVARLGTTYVDTSVAGGDWYLLGYGEYGNMGKLDASTGSFNAATRTGKATLDSVAFVRGATDLAVTWTTAGDSVPTGGILSYDHAVAFPLPNASTMNLSGAATNPNAGSSCSDFSRCGTNSGQSLVTLNVLKGSAGLPTQMYLRNVTFGVAYGGSYGLANNANINNQLDWNPDGQAFSSIYVGHTNNNGFVTPNGTGSGYTPRTMAIWARHPGPSCNPTSSVVAQKTVLTFSSVRECDWTVPANVSSADVLVVAGGGGGGGGGGGAGGVRQLTSRAISGVITVVVGAGGAGTATNQLSVGTQGNVSTFDGVSATGGGGGGNYTHQGTTGGSGGGGGQDVNHSSKAGVAGQGNAGGISNCDWYGGGGGGGGASTAGQNGGPDVGTPLSSCSSSGRADLNPTIGGQGGDGISSAISGSAVTYGGGGGGGVNSNSGAATSGGLGGAGGGGVGARCDRCDGTAGTNGLGGGGGGGDAEGRGGSGGSGIVIVSYVTPAAPTNTSAPVVSGTTRNGETLTTTNGTWSASPTSYSYQWKRASTSGGSYSDISLATSNSYKLTDADVGKFIKASVIATNSIGASTAELSAATSQISDVPAAPTTTSAPTTTAAPKTTSAPATTAAPALSIVIQAPVTTVAQGQASVATIAPLSTVARSGASVTTTTVAARVSSATTTTVARSVTTTTVGPPDIAKVSAGESSVLLDGVKTDTKVARENNAMIVMAGSVSAALSGINDQGKTVPLDSDGSVHLSAGDSIKVAVGGFKPDSEVEVWLFSTPVRLGSASVGSDGSMSKTFILPAGVKSGNHRVAVLAKLPNGKTATFTLGIVVGEISTTSTVTRVLIAIPIALAIGFGLILPTRLRRRRTIKA